MFVKEKDLIASQHILYYPVMAVARVNLYIQSFILHAKCKDPLLYRELDLGSLLAYWTWYSMILRFEPSDSIPNIKATYQVILGNEL